MDGEKAIVTAMAVISLFTLMGCNNRAEVDTLSPAQAAELKPMPQSWRGVLPCADCEGIETSVPRKDGTRVMNERYLGLVKNLPPSLPTVHGREPLTSWY